MTNIVGQTSNRVGPLPVAEKPLAGRTALVVGIREHAAALFRKKRFGEVRQPRL